MGQKEELIKKIKNEIPFVDIKLYSHNIISCCLRELNSICGKEEANEVIDKLNLEELGWNKE